MILPRVADASVRPGRQRNLVVEQPAADPPLLHGFEGTASAGAAPRSSASAAAVRASARSPSSRSPGPAPPGNARCSLPAAPCALQLPAVKFLSRLLTALNLLPSIATASENRRSFAAQHDELPTSAANGGAVVFTEVGDGLEVWHQVAGKPDQFTLRCASRSSRRLDWMRLK